MHAPSLPFRWSVLLIAAAAIGGSASWCLGQHEQTAPPTTPNPQGAAAHPASTPHTPAAHAPTASSVNEDDVARYREHVATLANPYLGGRGSGSRGNTLAADYIEWHFKQFGLKPILPETVKAADGSEVVTPNSSYRQSFEFGRDAIAVDQSLAISLTRQNKPVTFRAHSDYEALAVSGDANATGRLVFVGYGLDSGPEGHEDFSSFAKGDDLSGAVVLVLRFEPINDQGKSAFTGEAQWSSAASLYPRLSGLAKKGAAAILLAAPPGADDPRINVLDSATTTQKLGRPLDIPVVMLTRDAADRLVKAADPQHRSLESLRRLADKGGGVIQLSDGTVSVSAKIDRPARTTANVVGLLPGKGDLAKQYVVIGAHFDHLGDGTLGGSMKNEVGVTHPGADDNASGTSGMLLLAERFSKIYAGLPAEADTRSILFIGFSAEEIGLIGSRQFVRTAGIEASSIYAMLNMDMIGRLRDGRVEVNGTGTAENFTDLLDPLFTASGLDIKKIPGGRGPSDHASFYAGGIPVLFFFTGFHPEYHTPRDVSRLINCEGAVRVLDLVQSIATTFTTRTEPLVFRSTDRKEESDPHAGNPPASGTDPAAANTDTSVSGTRIRFGIMPDSYGEEDAGVPVGDVFPGTSAADAGIKKGDRLMKWNGELIDSVESWTDMLKKHKPGDVVNVTVKRGSEELVLPVKLKARGRGDG